MSVNGRSLHDVVHDALHRGVGRRPRSQARPSGLGFALFARASLGGKARSARGAPLRGLARLLSIAAIALLPGAALAGDAVPTEKDAVAASRVVKLSEKLRCLVCQNQSIADSSAELAQDLRRQIREQVAAGKTDDQIVEYMVARYGDFVLYEPPVKATTVLLWAGPALLLVAGFAGLVHLVRARRAEPPEPALTAEERERAARLLAGDAGKDSA